MEQVIKAIEEAKFLDPVTSKAADAAQKLFPGPAKDIASGTWLGHAAHPMLTDLPIGFWTSAMVLDFLGGRKAAKASDKLILAGILSAVPTAWTGIADWSDTIEKEQRIGAVHAVSNVAGLLCYGASYVARKKGRRAKGIGLSLIGATAMTIGGYLGGHLAYRKGVGVDETVFEEQPEDWTDAMNESDLMDGTPSAVEVKGASVLIYRNSSGELFAIADRCSHRGGPLHEGKVDQFNCTVTCPWHASEFSMETGKIVKGPATAPQPRYLVRLAGGRIQVRGAARGA